jgi:hypothetical protein
MEDRPSRANARVMEHFSGSVTWLPPTKTVFLQHASHILESLKASVSRTPSKDRDAFLHTTVSTLPYFTATWVLAPAVFLLV